MSERVKMQGTKAEDVEVKRLQSTFSVPPCAHPCRRQSGFLNRKVKESNERRRIDQTGP